MGLYTDSQQVKISYHIRGKGNRLVRLIGRCFFAHPYFKDSLLHLKEEQAAAAYNKNPKSQDGFACQLDNTMLLTQFT
jgi:hypothetical protein